MMQKKLGKNSDSVVWKTCCMKNFYSFLDKNDYLTKIDKIAKCSFPLQNKFSNALNLLGNDEKIFLSSQASV